MNYLLRSTIALALAANFIGCIDPKDRRPGFRLRGEIVEELPVDWSFSNAYKEIAIEVRTPYLIPHSVTISCAALDEQLYVGARNPDEKNWPDWVERDPNVRLLIGGQIYESKLALVEDSVEIAAALGAYAEKYEYPVRSADEAPLIRYWRVERRR